MKKILYFLIISSISYIAMFCIDTFRASEQSNILTNQELIVENEVENVTPQIENSEPSQTERMLQVASLQSDYPDVIGWIEIENTDINFPVVQGTDNNFYMKHNYKKQSSKNGAIFLDKDAILDSVNSNLLIYGHNMKNNTMFQHLLKYKDKSYFLEHPNIRFTTSKEDSIYEIFSVFESRVYYKSEKNVFRYYYFINAKNEQEYNSYVQNAINASLYDTGKTATYGEQLMTLSTCAYHVKDGRFVVVAKKRK